jgi:GNAT superfamily N-acetyltransferase
MGYHDLLQICNAGFVVSANHRGAGYGSLLAKSYVYYAPKLGYQGSVFNLVYVNNVASIKSVSATLLWILSADSFSTYLLTGFGKGLTFPKLG